ncbi:MAG: alpha/beta hydrolase family protein, partial [Bacteroidales bacterium]|nr:alpha/beta hydrolase family protein [Bacteroidales bacterium]
SMVIPELRSVYDFPDVAAMLYPRPMLFLSGEDDHLFPKDVVSEAYRRMNSIYDFLSAFGPVDSELRTEFFPGGHNCGKQVQALVVDFFRMNL